ncbi:MAG TPA: HAD family acid phosphatase [Gemmatimonadaceae bacterium]|nr:HAD family acid phosphatase [Gemmatimonadaceae bacterium]
MLYRPVFSILGLVLAACTSTPAPTTAPAPETGAYQPSKSIRWYRASAERTAIYREVYRAATERLEQRARTLAPQSWAVIMDADETVLDNSPNEEESDSLHQGFSDARFVAWVRRDAARALPGAVAFTQRVHQLGGKLAIVSNRADSLCDHTRRTLTQAGIAADEVLCQTGPTGDKNPRFQAIANGSAPSTLPALTVVMWLGDNIQDFPAPAGAQSIRSAPDSAFVPFGDIYFALPNPMYGSWEHNPLP